MNVFVDKVLPKSMRLASALQASVLEFLEVSNVESSTGLLLV